MVFPQDSLYKSKLKLVKKNDTFKHVCKCPPCLPLSVHVPDIITIHTSCSFPEESLITVCYALPHLHKEKR